jgi:hypothetical protein
MMLFNDLAYNNKDIELNMCWVVGKIYRVRFWEK